LLCGKKVYHVCASGQWDHANEFVIPGVLFLYITGWLGWTKICTLRKYNKIHLKMKLLPVAIGIMNSGFLWPVEAWKSLQVAIY
jgi:photosystem I subunit 3